MKRTLAIFGVVSVLTAAIVGGVFIRKKIIDDALYWRAWALFEAERKRNIRSVEEDIRGIDLKLKQETRNRENTNKNIEKYDEGIKKLVEDIKELEEQMNLTKSYFIPKKVVRIVDKNFNKQKVLNKKIKKFTLKIDNFILKNENVLNNEEINSISKIDELKKKIKEFSGILESQKEKLYQYAYRRIELSKKFKQYKTKKKETEEQKKNLEEKLNKDKNLLDELGNLIKKLQVILSEKTLKLSALKQQKFQNS